jgi:ABC-type nickel/cobalt efflux system permease component RcnA
LFWFSNRVTAIASPLLAFGLLHLQEVTSTQGWRWLFLVEGLITFSIGVWACFQMGTSHVRRLKTSR